MNYWLVKTEPDTYSWDDLSREKKTTWDGVRNFQARINLKSMQKGDTVFIYHSGADKSVIGLAKVLKRGYADPNDDNWVVVDITADKKLTNPVTLASIKSIKKLSNMVLVKSSRLSVQPVRKEEFEAVIALSKLK